MRAGQGATGRGEVGRIEAGWDLKFRQGITCGRNRSLVTGEGNHDRVDWVR